MNLSQKQNVCNAIQDFNTVENNFENIAAEKYKNETSLETIIIQEYSLTEILTYSRDVIKKLSNRLEQDNWQILPYIIITHEFGQFNLDRCILELTNLITKGDFNHTVIRLKALIYYAITNAFWNIPIKTEINNHTLSLNKLKTQAQLTIDYLNKHTEIANSTIKILNDKIQELNQFITKKQSEFNNLHNNQSQSNILINDISNTKKHAENYNQIIEQIKNKCSNILSDLEKKQEKIKSQQDKINEQIEIANINLDNFQIISKEKIESIQKGYDSVSTNVETVKNMMGYIADGTLSHSFNNRKKNIERSKKTWMWISLFTLVALIIWICIIFMCLNANTGIVWADIIINGIKATPLAFAFGFALTEYNKERNLLEEYAFKEAVAITLTAYMERLNGKNTEEQNELLLNTVENLYTKPIISYKEYKLFNFDTKDIAKTAESIKELKK